jgi:hypothetical protein
MKPEHHYLKSEQHRARPAQETTATGAAPLLPRAAASGVAGRSALTAILTINVPVVYMYQPVWQAGWPQVMSEVLWRNRQCV